MDGYICLDAQRQALTNGRPKFPNSRPAAQFTAENPAARLQSAEIKINMDGGGRSYDDTFYERLWRRDN